MSKDESLALVPTEQRRASLAEEAEHKRAEVQDTLQKIDARIGRTVDRVEGAVDQVNEAAVAADAFVRQHRWAFIAGGVALGVALGHRKRSQETAGPSMASGLFGALASVAARQAAKAVVNHLLEGPPALPVPKDESE